jgi:hypothetical protein
MFRNRIEWELGEKLKKNRENEKGEKNKNEKHDVKKRCKGRRKGMKIEEESTFDWK